VNREQRAQMVELLLTLFAFAVFNQREHLLDLVVLVDKYLDRARVLVNLVRDVSRSHERSSWLSADAQVRYLGRAAGNLIAALRCS
jgi:hypothetical protein